MWKVKKENDSETQHANFWEPDGALGFTWGFGCFSIASTARSYKKKIGCFSIASDKKHPQQKHSLLQEKVDASDLIPIGTRCLIGASVHRGAICIFVVPLRQARGVESAEQS